MQQCLCVGYFMWDIFENAPRVEADIFLYG